MSLLGWLFREGDERMPRALRNHRVEAVLQPCARGKAPHRWPSRRQADRTAAYSDGNGILPDACMVCGQVKP